MGADATFEVDASEHRRAMKAISWHAPGNLIALGGMALLICLFLAQYLQNDPDALLMLFFLFGSLLVGVAGFFWTARKAPRGSYECLVNSAGLHVRSQKAEQHLPWNAMNRVVENQEFFLFYITKWCAYYLPKRTLSTEEVTEVRSLAQAELGQRTRLIKE